MTRAELARVVDYLGDSLVGARIQKIRQYRSEAAILECRTHGESLLLLFSVHSRFARFAPLNEKPAEPAHASDFVILLRRRLVNGVIVELAVDPADRIVTLSINKRDEDGGEQIWILVAELFGARGNLLLLDPQGSVANALLPKRLNGRGLQINGPYVPSPPLRGNEPRPDCDLPIYEMAAAFSAQEKAFEFETLRANLHTVLSREIKKVSKYASKLNEEEAGLPDAERLTMQGQTLLSYLYQVKRGQARVQLPNVTDPDGGLIAIDLDPARSPQENADLLFKQARRNRRKRENLRERFGEMESRTQLLAQADTDLSTATSLEQLDALHERLREMGIVRGPVPQLKSGKAKAIKPKQTSGPQPFFAADGAQIFVGRNDRENDELTFRLARGNDYWLHVEGAPGSHVVIKLPASGELNGETLLDAASLAILHSDLKSAKAGSVMYTRRKNVRKPKNAAPGKVTAAAIKSIFVRLDDLRIKRLYQSRL